MNTQLLLATWAVMKAYVRVAGSGPEVSDAESRRLLMDQRRPAANIRVLLGHYAPHGRFACYHNPVETVESRSEVLDTPGFATIFVLMHGVIQVVGRERSSFSWPHVPPKMLDNARSIVPPFPSSVAWPAGEPLDESNIEAFAAQLIDIPAQDRDDAESG